jgi:hypothetical protein
VLRDNVQPRRPQDTHCWRCKGLLAKDQSTNTCSPCQRALNQPYAIGYMELARMPKQGRAA